MTVNITKKLGQKSEETGTDPFTENRLFLNDWPSTGIPILVE